MRQAYIRMFQIFKVSLNHPTHSWQSSPSEQNSDRLSWVIIKSKAWKMKGEPMTEMAIAPEISRDRFGKFPLFLTFLYLNWALVLIGFGNIAADNPESGTFLMAIGMIFGILSLIFGSIIFFHLWKFSIEESELAGLAPSVNSPGRVLGFCFIPLFNFYWAFVAWGKLPKDLNALAGSRECTRRLSQGLGITIPILSILSIIPLVGYVPGIIAGCVLIPLFLRNAIRLCREIEEAAPAGNAQEKKAPASHVTVPGIEWRSIRSFSELFHHPHRRFNFHLIVILSITTILMMLSMLIFFFRGDTLSYLAFSKVSVLSSLGLYIAVWFGFVGLCSLVSKNWLLPFVWAALSFAIRFGWGFLFGGGLFSDGSGITFVLWPFPESFVGLLYDFTRSICFVAGPVLAIQLFRVRIWSLIAGMIGGFLMLSIVDYFVGMLVYGDFSIAWFTGNMPIACYWAIYGVSFYAGFHLHFRRFSRKYF